MFWKRKAKSLTSDDLTSRLQEGSRRHGVVLRTQLELLRSEGSLPSILLSEILSKHPRTISSEEPKIDVPMIAESPKRVQMTYSVAVKGLIGYVAKDLTEVSSIFKTLDPKNLGWYHKDNAVALALDVMTGVVFLRNRALCRLLDTEEAREVEAAAVRCLEDTCGSQVADLYGELMRTWFFSLPVHDVFQVAIAQVLIKRSCVRRKQPYQEDPIKDVCLADVLVTTQWFFWQRVFAEAALRPDA